MAKPTKRSSRAFDPGKCSNPTGKWLFPSLAGRPARRRRSLNGSFGVESLETRALLSNFNVSLVKDINSVDLFPAQLTPAGTNLFYTVADGTSTGEELVVTTAGGTTTKLMDFNSDARPSDLTAVGNNLYFLSDGAGGTGLWTSDGTVPGTKQISFSDPNQTDSNVPSYPTNVGGTLFFLSSVPESTTTSYGPDLWALPPGATQPTLIAADVTGNSIGVRNLTAVGDVLYFTVTSGTDNVSVYQELWQSNGVAGEAGPVTYVDPNTHQSTDITDVDSITNFNGSLYYVSEDLTTDTKGLETYDVATEPQLVSALSFDQTASGFMVVGSNLFFSMAGGSVGTQLWVTTGPQNGAQELVDINPDFDTDSAAGNLTNVDGTLYFTATGPDNLNQLWKSDGTSQGTALVMDLPSPTQQGGYPTYGSYWSIGDSPSSLAALGGTLFFADSDAAHGTELWSLSATQPPALVDDIDPGSGSSAPHDLVNFNGEIAFAAHDGTTPQVNQLWETSGAVTQAVASFSPAVTPGSYVPESEDTATTIGSEVIFIAGDGVDGPAVWATDGTTGGTTLLADVETTSFVAFQGAIYFIGSSPSSNPALWETNGTVQGTSLIKALPAEGAGSSYEYDGNLTAADGELFFTTNDGKGGQDLWVSDGSAMGTTVVKDLNQESTYNGQTYYYGLDVNHLTAAAGKLFFTGNDPAGGTDLWVSDGTTQGTTVLKEFNPSASPSYEYINGLTPANGLLFISANNGTDGYQPWVSNGTTTQLLANINPGGTGSDPSDFTALGDDVYFFATESSTGTVGLWKTGGTPATTQMVFDSFPTITVTQPTTQTLTATPTNNLTAIGSTLFFSLDYSNSGSSTSQYELWTSAGESNGTSQVSPPQLNGAKFSAMGSFTAFGNLLVFAANDGTHGDELWKSDGTDTGTAMIDDIDPGSGSGIPDDYTLYDNTVENNGLLYFIADDGTDGEQVWATDGTQTGTQMVSDFSSGGDYSTRPSLLAAENSQVLFYADDGIQGQELWSASPATDVAITPIPAQTVTAHQTLSLSVQATNSGDPTPNLVYALVDDPPTGATINPSSGAFSWQPTATGTFSIAVQATDTNQQGDPSTIDRFQVVVNPAVASQLAITSPPLSFEPGNDGQVTLQLEDQYGNLGAVSSSPQTINLTSTSPAGLFYASQTSTTPITSVVIGTGQTSVSVYYSDTKAGNPILTASDTALGSAPTQHETITPAAANHLVVTAQPPSPITAGQGFVFVVAAEDKFNNVDTNFTGSVSISLAGDPGFTTSVQAAGGVARFSGLIVDASASGLAIQVASTSLTGGGTATNPLDVTPPPTPPPSTNPAPTVSLENVVLTKKTKKGKPVFTGFMLKFSTAMNSSTAGLAGNYHLFANVVKKVKKKTTTTLKPVPFTVSYSQSSNAVSINVSSTKPFAKGGQITVSGVTSQAGVLLSASDTTFTITANAKGIILA